MDIDSHILSINPPGNFSADSSMLYDMDLSFGKLCAGMEESGISNPKKLSVFDFNAKLDYLEEKNKKQK